MRKTNETYDVVVCGGGLAGFCAAVSAARHGAKTCLVQDRPVFGGNSSSEIRVTPHGAAAFHAYARESGIVSELLIEERARNHEEIFENGWTNSVWDMTMYDMAMNTPNLVFHLNTSIFDVIKDERRHIQAIVGRVGGAETEITIAGKVFIDCTGDGIVADLAGCEWRMGSEGRSEFNEYHAPELASKDTMGNSIHFRARDMGRPVPFRAPDWAVKHEDASYFYEDGREPKELRGGYWWLEIGVPWDTIHDAEDIRHELTRHTLGVWDWIKNKDPKLRDKAANFALDWIGQVPGKRESRRIMGQYLMTEHDPAGLTVFPDEIAFGGWFLDLHTPGGLLAAHSEPASAENYTQTSEYAVKSYCGPYGIPLRILIAKDTDNLMMAGRNVSVTHAALGTVRVMSTTALMGQAAGIAAWEAIERNIAVAKVPEQEQAVFAVQQKLLRDGCFLPNYRNEDPADLARSARVMASSEARCYGLGPFSTGAHEGLSVWRDQNHRTKDDRLHTARSQWIAVGVSSSADGNAAGGAEIRSLSVCLSSHAPDAQTLRARIVPVDHIWDYQTDAYPALAETELLVPPGDNQWIDWKVELTEQNGLAAGRYVRLELSANPEVEWHKAGAIEPGHVAAMDIGMGRMRRYDNGVTLSFKVDPPQACYGASNTVSGVTRPHAYTNVWRSDPREPLDQWLELEWDEPQRIGQVELTFPGHLLREYHAYSPFYRDAQCPKSYSIQIWEEGRWRTLHQEPDNYQRHRRHRLAEQTATTRLRIAVHATNGDPSAAIYEVRCYE
ncbi:FAD-dependent oxidoreductase [Paenibacillus thalictri]|uniref:FAD-dependent oxidoreductase n=1 Tax=Paenibacillus thalictri TaxID=2527873 RepID=A0A4Q9DH04_9BACL|nr:FAD-dependent oxidoreductase [Paenibacillus thalictri]TBL70567.1 FAD-dependent oxidoreductase [Paenibacillus thalictri]